MRWASFVSEEPVLEVAVSEAADEIDRRLEAEPDLLLVFASPHHADDYPAVPAELRRFYPQSRIVGCSGGGVVGGGREVEHSPAISITAANLPGISVQPFHVDAASTDDLVERPAGWFDRLSYDTADPAHFVLFADPFSCDARGLLASLDTAFPESPKIGGLASGAGRPGENALFIDDSVLPDGAAGLLLNGNIHMDTIVAQGCRPIGSPLFITAAVRNRILELDGRKPTAVLGELYDQLPESDRSLFRHSLFVGLVMDDGRSEYGHGDFLVRNLVGIDTDAGVVAVGDMVRPGQVMQFHLRDAATSAEDLDLMLRNYKSLGDGEPEGALLFSCLGRGETLYGEPDHDCRLINNHLGPVPIGGFFCNGEIGPVDQRTFLHGYTSSIALFRSRARQ